MKRESNYHEDWVKEELKKDKRSKKQKKGGQIEKINSNAHTFSFSLKTKVAKWTTGPSIEI